MVRPESIAALSGIRGKIADLVEHPKFVGFITTLILINAVALGVETSARISENFRSFLDVLDIFVLSIFSLEILFKFYAYRFGFFRSGWNVFDLIIVAISWAPSSGPLTILRALRILRVLRLLSVVPQMRRVIAAIAHSIPGMVSVVGVLLLIFYVSAVLVTKLFGQHPDPQMQEWFGTIGASAYTLFQIMTLESWSMGIVRPTMELYPLSWLFFVPFIVITSFAVLNLFIGIIVDAMQSSHMQEELEEQQTEQVTLENLQRELSEIKELLLQREKN